MENFFRSVMNRVKGIELDHIQEKVSQFGDKAKKAANDIDLEGLKLKKQEIGTKFSEFRDKARLKLEQIEEEGRRRKIDRDIEKARKEEERKQIREAFNLKVVNFFKTLAKVFVLFVLVVIFLNIVFHDKIERLAEFSKINATEATSTNNSEKDKNSQGQYYQRVDNNSGESYFKTHMDEIYNELKSNWRRNKNYDVGRYCVKVSQKNEEDFTACMGMARLAYEELKTEW
jgi:hypothetical protein